MRKAPYRPLTDEEMRMPDDELMAWMNEQNAKDAQHRTALKAERKEIVKAIQETDNEALGRAGKLFFAGIWCERASKETQAAYDLLRRLYWIDSEM